MPKTLQLNGASAADIARASSILQSGGTVAFPTETVYGLGANALDPDAVAKIFAAKQRPSWDPLIVHIADQAALPRLTVIPQALEDRINDLAAQFWPGPLTLLLPKRPVVPDAVTAGRPLVGIRIPAHPIAREILATANIPVAAPSANTFGHTSPTTANHVLDDLDGRIDAVLDGGATNVGLESTVLDPTQTPMVLYRPGAVSAEAIEETAGVAVSVFVNPQSLVRVEPQALPSPGVGIRHYAPKARVVLTAGNNESLTSAVAALPRSGVLLPSGWSAGKAHIVQYWGRWDDALDLAQNLFAALRAIDARSPNQIVCPLPEPGGLNDAIRDRLMKAARLD